MSPAREQNIEPAPGRDTPPRFLNPGRHWLAFALIAAAALAMTLYRLGSCGICKGNEAVEAIFIQQMVEHGRILFPAVNGGSPMYKPPLFHWTAAALDAIAGVKQVTPFNFRLPAALYTTAGVLLTMVFAYGIISIDGAIIAGLTLLATHQYIRLGRMGRVDITLAFFETLALFAFWWWFDGLQQPNRERPSMLYLAAAAIGLAVLSKGPVGAIIPALSIAIFLIAQGSLREALRKVPLPAMALAVVIGASWYIAGYIDARHALLSRQLGSENFGRFFGALGSSPPWFYLGPLLFSAMPISLLVPIAVGAVFLRGSDAKGAQTSPASARSAVQLLAIFWLVTLLFFSAAAYKSRWYLMPLWPSAAVILAWWIKRIGARYGPSLTEGGFAGICVAVAALNLYLIPCQEMRECGRFGYRATATEIRRLVGPAQPLYAAGFVDEDFAPLLFYLDRDAPFIPSDLAAAPPGFIIVPAELWEARQNDASGFEVLLRSTQGRRKPVLLRHLAGVAR